MACYVYTYCHLRLFYLHSHAALYMVSFIFTGSFYCKNIRAYIFYDFRGTLITKRRTDFCSFKKESLALYTSPFYFFVSSLPLCLSKFKFYTFHKITIYISSSYCLLFFIYLSRFFINAPHMEGVNKKYDKYSLCILNST